MTIFYSHTIDTIKLLTNTIKLLTDKINNSNPDDTLIIFDIDNVIMRVMKFIYSTMFIVKIIV